MADEKPLQKLYNSLVKDGYELPEYSTFEKDMNTGDNLDKLYGNIKGDYDLPDFNQFKTDMFGGTNPAEKKNDNTALSSGGGSSELLSVKFGGEDYEVNPTTQEVFKGGKPVTVPQNIKDYIAKNIIGVETPQVDTSVGAVGADGQPMQPIGATGAGLTGTISDKVIAEQTRRGAGGGEEIRVEFTPQQQAKIEAIGLNPDQFRNSPLNEYFQKLAKQFAPNADFGDEKQVDQVLDDYQAFTAINKADNLAKELNIPRKQLSQVMKDQAAEAFLDVPEQAIFDIDKKRDEAVAKGATPEELKKIDEDRNKAVDFVLSKVDRDIVNLNKAKAFPNLTPDEIAKIDQEIANKKASYNNLTKKPSQIIDGILKTNPSLNLLDKKYKGLDDKQRLGLLYDGILADLYTTGRDLGFSLTDIKSGKVDISTFFGFGEKGRKFVDLYNQAQQLASAVLINKAPNARQDTFLDTFSNSFLGGLSTAMGANTTTEQQKGVIISDFLDKARVEPSEETAKNLGKKLDDYGLGGAFWGQALGGSAAAGASIALAEFGLNPIFNGMRASRFLAPIVDLMEGTKLGRAARTGLGYEVGGRIVPASSGEADFLSGFVGEWATLLPVKFKGLAVPIAKLFGDQADKAAKIIGDFVKRGVGEMGQETAQSLYQIYRDTPAGQSVFDGIKQQFGDPSEALKFAISTFLMGGAMGGGSDLGMHRANVDAVKNLNPDEKVVYDTFTGEQRKKANTDIIDIAKEQVTKVPTDNLEAQADNTQEAITKLQSVAPDQDYSVEVDGIKYEGNNAEDLQSDIDYLKQLNGIVNDELYKRKTETPPIAEADQGDVELAKPEAGVGVEGEIKFAEPTTKAEPSSDVLNQPIDYSPTGEPKSAENIAIQDEVGLTKKMPQGVQVKESISDIQESPTAKVQAETISGKFPDLNDRAQSILDQSIKEYQSATPEQQTEMIAKVEEQLAIDEKGVEQIGMGLDADKVAAGKVFLQTVKNETQQATESPTTVTVNTGTVENAPTETAIPTEQIKELKKGGTKRQAALESIDKPQVKEVAKKLTQPKFFDTIYDKIETDDPMLLELQEKLGFKKICK